MIRSRSRWYSLRKSGLGSGWRRRENALRVPHKPPAMGDALRALFHADSNPKQAASVRCRACIGVIRADETIADCPWYYEPDATALDPFCPFFHVFERRSNGHLVRVGRKANTHEEFV